MTVAIGALLLLTCALGLALALRSITKRVSRAGSAMERALRPEPRPRPELPQLDELGRDVAFGLQTAGDFHFRVAPSLREVAAACVSARHGVDLGRASESRRLLGEETWALVDPARPPPHDRYAKGPDAAALRRALERLEGL